MPKPTNRELVRQVVALARVLRSGPRSHADPALDELTTLLDRGLSRRTFPDELMHELRRAGLHVDPEALAHALTQQMLH